MIGLRTALAMLGIVLLAACGVSPRDIEDTRSRVETSRIVRVGIFQSALAGPDRLRALVFLDRLRRATGASPQAVTGAAEPLLARLEAGELDLVIGEIATDSPWVTAVAVIEPLTEHQVGGRTIGLSPIARNGENRWIMLLEREVRDSRSGG
jgi:hypothetical protein